MGHKAGIGAIFGIVTEEGIVKPDSPVVLLDRENRKIVRRQNTDANGGFTFNGLNEQEATYMVFATDEDGDEPKNALIQDRILPVPAYSGATLWANWEYVARRDGASGVWSGDYVEHVDGIHPFDSQAFQSHPSQVAPSRQLGTGQITISVNAPVSGAPHIPRLRFQQKLVKMALGIPYNRGVFNTNSPGESVEAVINLESLASAVCIGASPGTSRSSSYGTYGFYYWWTEQSGGTSGSFPFSFLQLRYDPSTREVLLYYRTGPSRAATGVWSVGVGGTTYAGKVFTFGEGEVPTGLVHLIATVDPGVAAKLFVNGVKVADWDLVAENPTLPGPSYQDGWAVCSWTNGGMLIISGPATSNAPNAVADGEFGPVAVYPGVVLTDAQALEHYEVLMTTTALPKLTGYVREVITDRPALYARLDDTESDVLAREFYQVDFLREFVNTAQRAPVTSAAQVNQLRQYSKEYILLEQPSPVIGGMATVFSGGYLRADAVASGPSISTEFSVEFFARPSETPSAGERILYVQDSAATNTVYVTIDSSRALTLGYQRTSSSATILFTTPLPFTTDSHVAITVDTVLGAHLLYIDGSLVETIIDAPGASLQSYLRTATNEYLFIAGTTTGVTTFKGMLCEVAVYPRALPASRVLAHYNARLIP